MSVARSPRMTFSHRIRSQPPPIGTLVSSRSPEITEVLASAGKAVVDALRR